MADDLDAFFDEVSDVEAKAKQEGPSDEQDEQSAEDVRPTKKLKPNAAIPRGVVVAAASSVKKIEPSDTSATSAKITADSAHRPLAEQAAIHPPPPPPLPATNINKQVHPVPSKQQNDLGATQSISTTGNFTLFIGNLGAETTEVDLYNHFAEQYSSVHQSQIVRNADGESKGFGFISFTQALDCARAKREMDQSWLGARPIRIKKYHGTTTGGTDKQKNHKKKNKR
jgi:hypothetical protein